MDLPKVFHWIHLDLMIAKLPTYGLNGSALRLLYSYLKDRKQCFCINNTYWSVENISSGIPQGSILGSPLFNLSINDLYFFTAVEIVHTFADDNTLRVWASSTSHLVKILETQSNLVIDRFTNNKIIVNPDKLQAILN